MDAAYCDKCGARQPEEAVAPEVPPVADTQGPPPAVQPPSGSRMSKAIVYTFTAAVLGVVGLIAAMIVAGFVVGPPDQEDGGEIVEEQITIDESALAAEEEAYRAAATQVALDATVLLQHWMHNYPIAYGPGSTREQRYAILDYWSDEWIRMDDTLANLVPPQRYSATHVVLKDMTAKWRAWSVVEYEVYANAASNRDVRANLEGNGYDEGAMIDAGINAGSAGLTAARTDFADPRLDAEGQRLNDIIAAEPYWNGELAAAQGGGGGGTETGGGGDDDNITGWEREVWGADPGAYIGGIPDW